MQKQTALQVLGSSILCLCFVRWVSAGGSKNPRTLQYSEWITQRHSITPQKVYILIITAVRICGGIFAAIPCDRNITIKNRNYKNCPFGSSSVFRPASAVSLNVVLPNLLHIIDCICSRLTINFKLLYILDIHMHLQTSNDTADDFDKMNFNFTLFYCGSAAKCPSIIQCTVGM
jgi:hypothetical protein